MPAIELSFGELQSLEDELALTWGIGQNLLARIAAELQLDPVLVARVPLQVDNLGYLRWAIQHCLQDGFASNPALLRLLIRSSLAFSVKLAELDAKLARLEAEERTRAAAFAQGGIDRFRPVLMRRRQPLLAREAGSAALARLVAPNDAAIYVVRGVVKSGKSYTKELVIHVAEEVGRIMGREIRVAYVELVAGMAELEHVSLLASTFSSRIQAGRMAFSLPGPPSPTPKWIREVADHLVNLAIASGQVWWIVIDGVPAPKDEDDWLEKFIQALARTVADLPAHDRVGLILLGYERQFPTDILPAVVPEDLPPPENIGRPHLERFFNRYFLLKGGGHDAGAIDAAVFAVFAYIEEDRAELRSRGLEERHYLTGLGLAVRGVVDGLG
ncbi:hypothetical protein [Methylobacterium trifolii]|uniref:ATP-binding protein n=1 Tax=Methylobacterium trifolii TaxID=1003092 RepID=A0ABQ4U5N6_9HYPH|nr:hypothetical protein [Methylobacterium trifolii]GJE62439.1 hypothetical protein MPOCJGCO_4572 [Methylobacterium trifolii]